MAHFGRLTGQSLFVQQITPEQGIIWQYGQELPIHRYYTIKQGIERIQGAIAAVEQANRIMNNPVAIDAPDWIEELEAFEADAEVAVGDRASSLTDRGWAQ